MAQAFTLYTVGYAVGTLANVTFFYLFASWTEMLIYYYLVLFTALLISFYFFVESPPIEIISHNKDP